MRRETYKGRKLQTMKGTEYGYSRAKINGVDLGRHMGDEDAAMQWMKNTVDFIDREDINGDRWAAEWYVPGTYELCENGHPKTIGGECLHSYCVERRPVADEPAEVANIVDSWQAARAELHEIERFEHPDITDRFGRVWTWKSKDLYRHCGTACPADMVDHFGLPTQRVLDNQNYDLCDTCIDGRTRNVRVCKPEWNCTHNYCAANGAPVVVDEPAESADEPEIGYEPGTTFHVGDVVAYPGRPHAEVIREAVDGEDLFGRPIRRLYCRALGGDREGFVDFGPGGVLPKLRQPERAKLTT